MEDLRVPLRALRRGAVHRSLRIEDASGALGELPEGLGPIEVEVDVSGDPREGVRVTGRLRASAEIECRRCLTPVPFELDAPVDVWFRPATEVVPGEEGVWPLDTEAGEVDLTAPLREELWVRTPEYPVCRSSCRGLCAKCGEPLGAEACTCTEPEPDPRWESLRALRAEEPGSADQG